jgi:hypothetical protein
MNEAWERPGTLFPLNPNERPEETGLTYRTAGTSSRCGKSYQAVAFSLITTSKVTVFTVAPLAIAISVT